MKTVQGNSNSGTTTLNSRVSRRGKLQAKLLLLLLGASLIPLIIVSSISYLTATASLRKAANESLSSTVNAKAAFISNWFHYRFIDLKTQSASTANSRFLTLLNDAYGQSGTDLESFVRSDSWNLIADEHNDDLINFRKYFQYHDIFLINTEGDILFTVMSENDLGRNLYSGDLTGTLFAAACRKAFSTGKAAFSDLEYYGPSHNNVAGFIVNVILDEDGDKIGLFAIQITSAQIDHALGQGGISKTHSHTYVVGYSDMTRAVTLRTPMLSDSDSDTDQRDRIHSDYLNLVVESEQTRKWTSEYLTDRKMEENHSDETFAYTNHLGERVLGIHSNIEIAGVPWGVIAEIPVDEAFADSNTLRNLVTSLLALTAIIVIIVAIFVTRGIVRPIVILSNAAKRVANGDISQGIISRTNDEIGELSESFNTMVDSLRDADDTQKRENWIKTAQTEIAEEMRGEQSIGSLTRRIVTYLAKYLNAQVGAFYLVDKQTRLVPTAGYALPAGRNLTHEYEPGEGLVGQAALEQEPILLTDVPHDYITINSALGASPPRSILVWPVIRDNVVEGVIELGSLELFSKDCLSLLELVSESIAIGIASSQSRRLLQNMLEQSQAQSQELQAQAEILHSREEELRKTNRRLAEKTDRLETSEETLRQQSKELHISNEELQEKTISLEKQATLIEKARQELEEKAHELESSSRYKSEFLANMSHELRTPLNSLLILAGVLVENDEGNLTPGQVKSATIIKEGGEELLTLINDILDLSKVESGKMEAFVTQVNIQDMIEGLSQQFAPQVESKGLTLAVEVAKDLRKIMETDERKVVQIIRNLMSNALKFTHEGSIKLQVKRPESGTRLPRISLTHNSAIAFSVVDTGIGIPNDSQKAIFESFQQADGSTSRQYGGTGLGLTISREFAKLLGGGITLTSREGEGSTFTLYLPLSSRPEGESAEPSQSLSEPVHERSLPETARPDPAITTIHLPDDRHNMDPDDRSILIVEDDKNFAQTLMDLCGRENFKCLSAESGKQALQMAMEYKPDAILLDLGLPDIDGMVVLDELKDNMTTRHIPIYVVSGRGKDATAMIKGAMGFLTKPVSVNEIIEVLNGIGRLLDTSIKQLLIIEDNDDTIQRINDIIQIEGVMITEATSGEEGLKQIQDGDFDCVVMDSHLRGMSGFDLLRTLKTDSIRMPPTVIYSDKELSLSEQEILESFGCSILTRDATEHVHLTDKVSLFLHSVESALPEGPRQAIQSLHDPTPVLKGKKILIVDDDMRNIYALSNILEKSGMIAVLAGNGQLAIDLLDRMDDVDLVLMDIMMPVMDGFEAMRLIRKNPKTAEIPIIALTAKAMPEDRNKCLNAGADGYLSKPVDIDRLMSMLRVWSSSKIRT
ncbi:MAG: response regulator [bacterium]|nr:response regulator [bacterium]